ncbi:MAG: glycosyltransferase family 4 protein [Thermoplasmata archaeon]|nr:glycosyltransferase family 4 protein [Thermoplasmata archaeon]
MKKVCIITKDLTAEPKIGFALHVHNLAKELGKKYRVDVISFGGGITESKIIKIANNVSIIEMPDIFSLFIGAITYKIFKKPTLDYFLSVSADRKKSFKKIALKKIEDADVVIFEGCWHAGLLPYIPEEKLVIYNAHNLEYALKRQVYTDFVTKRFFLEKIYRIEREMVINADYIFALSPTDASEIVTFYKIDPAKILVNFTFAVDVPDKNYTRKHADPKALVFMGSSYFANIEGAKFINEVLAADMPEYEFHIIGEAGNHIKKPKKNVRLHGFVGKEDKQKILERCGIAIAPIFHGSGICGKIIEYMAYSLPVVCTPLAFRGLGVPEDLLILAEMDDFAEKIRNCDAITLEALSKKGREFFLRYRTPEMLIQDWEKVIERGHK